jgi:hypothetical protein
MYFFKPFLACAAVLTVSGCGLYTPRMDLLSKGDEKYPPMGEFQANVESHVGCEISLGLLRAASLPGASKTLAWLKKYGALVTFKLVAEDQSALSPNASFPTPIPGMQTFTVGIGASGTANATQTRTFQTTYPDGFLYEQAKINQKNGIVDCKDFEKGVMIESNLGIADYIYDTAFQASHSVNPDMPAKTAPLSQMQYEINFVASVGGNFTPTWKFTKVNVNSSGSLLSATRTNTSDVLMTIGPLNEDTRSLHSSALIGTAVGLTNQSLAH